MRVMKRTIPFTRKLVVSIKDFLLGGTAAFNPASLFTGGILGYAYDPSDYSKVWQDSARTTPVTAVSDPIGCIDDISGNGANRTQATSGKRPLAATSGYYDFDGVDDGMGSTVDTSGGGIWTHIARLQTDGDTTFVTVLAAPSGEFFGAAQSGSVSTVLNSNSTLTTLEVDGSAVSPLQRGALYTALNGGNKTMFSEFSSITNSSWLSTFRVGDYAGAFAYSGKFGREILINKSLSSGEKASAIAWVEAF